MTEKVRKRVSKWDIPAEIIQEDILPVKHVDDKEEKVDWTCSKWDGNQLFKNSVENILYKDTSEANQPSKWFEFQGDDIRISRESSGRPQSPKIPDAEADDTESCKRLHGEPIPEQTPDETVAQSPLPEVEAVGKDDLKWSGLEPNSLNKTTEKDSDAWGIALEQNQRTSPHRDGWGAALDQNQRREGWGAALDQNRRTPDAWKKPRQSNSPQSARSRPLRSRSQGRSRSRSRSRSPYRSKHGSERWGERGRTGSGAVETCRAFAAGRCNKGSQCRYLHEDGSRRDHSRDRSIERHGNRYEGDYRNKSTERCFDFTQGRCQRGSSCRFVHHDPASGDGRSSKDEPREWIHDRGDSLGRRTADVPYRRVSDFPCKYFAEGRCRNGDACKFLHRGELDDNRDYNCGTGPGSNRGEQGKGNGNDSRSRLPAVAVVPLPQHAQSFGPSIQIQQAVPPPPQPQMKQFYTVPPNGHQGQYIPPLNPPPSFTHSGPVQPSFNVGAPLNQPNVHQIHMGIPLAQSVAPNQQNLGVYSVKTPELKLDVLPITPKAVTSEQAAQITNLSASLAQFFGNGPQLPQLYAPPPQQQPNPVDNISVPPGFSSVDPKDPEPSLKISAPVSAADDSNAVDKGNTASKNDTGTKKEHSGNADSEGKDSKETRAFKCALVEFVKDVLKPAWKEGHLSKEVHKTIVKKVVEKVTGAMKGSSSIPQTQEKIDVYLDYAKEKLKKLVQAYLEKYV